MERIYRLIGRAANIPTPGRYLVGMFIAFVLVAQITAFLTYLAVRGLVMSRDTPHPPALAIPTVSALSTPRAEKTPLSDDILLQSGDNPPPQEWDGVSRVNVLILGLDRRGEAAAASNADTLLLVSLDPATQMIRLLSIPNNLWVNIPGFESGFLGEVYRLGELTQPGGGPGLTLKAVEGLLGMKINFYVEVDFEAFERLVDEIGGIKIDVPFPLMVVPLGEGRPKNLQPGVQVLSGELALAYARAANIEGDDFDRLRRQQQVVMGIRNRFLRSDLLTTLIRNAPALYTQVASGVRSNATLLQVIQMAWIARQIPEENIEWDFVGAEQVEVITSEDGEVYLRPISEQIRLLCDELFTLSGPPLPLSGSNGGRASMESEAATVYIFNGAAAPGLAIRTADYLQSQGIHVGRLGNADKHYVYTAMIDYTGNPHTIEYLADLMDITPEQIFHQYDPYSEVDVALLLGEDWALLIP